MLIIKPNGLEFSRFAITVGRSIGNAVQRNRVKRHIREALNIQISMIKNGWDMVYIARQPIKKVKYQDVLNAVTIVTKNASLFRDDENI